MGSLISIKRKSRKKKKKKTRNNGVSHVCIVEDWEVCGGVVLQLYSTGWAARAFIRWGGFCPWLMMLLFSHYWTNIYSKYNHLGILIWWQVYMWWLTWVEYDWERDGLEEHNNIVYMEVIGWNDIHHYHMEVIGWNGWSNFQDLYYHMEVNWKDELHTMITIMIYNLAHLVLLVW